MKSWKAVVWIDAEDDMSKEDIDEAIVRGLMEMCLSNVSVYVEEARG